MPKSSQSPSGFTVPFNESEVPWDTLSEGTKFGNRWRALGKFGGGSHIGVSVEELPPGKQSVPFHYHLLEEEHMYVLSGTATLRLGDKRYTMKAGDYCCFPAGQKAGHCLINESTDVFRFIMIGENNPNEVCVYPDGNRVGVRGLGQGFELTATKEYWAGENTKIEDTKAEKTNGEEAK
jgi:uncharacterized cupin superfamily protein